MVGYATFDKVPQWLANGPTHKVKSIEFVGAENMNHNTAVAVDVVFIFEEKLVDELPEITARSWFTQRQAYMAAYPGLLAVASYELVPRFRMTIEPEALRTVSGLPTRKAKAVILFADYLVESKAYTLDINHFKNPVVTLGQTTISVSE